MNALLESLTAMGYVVSMPYGDLREYIRFK